MFLLALLVAMPAAAQDYIGVRADFGGGLEPVGVTKTGEPFDVVVVMHPSHDSAAAEFVITELMNLFPGVFKFQTTRINNTPLDLGNNQQGEYIIAYGVCVESSRYEAVRIRYFDVDGSIGRNVVLEVGGLGPDASFPSTFGGEPGYVDCADAKHTLRGLPWEADTGIDPMLIEGVTSTDGIMVLNPDGISVDAEATSVGALKTRF